MPILPPKRYPEYHIHIRGGYRAPRLYPSADFHPYNQPVEAWTKPFFRSYFQRDGSERWCPYDIPATGWHVCPPATDYTTADPPWELRAPVPADRTAKIGPLIMWAVVGPHIWCAPYDDVFIRLTVEPIPLDTELGKYEAPPMVLT